MSAWIDVMHYHPHRLHNHLNHHEGSSLVKSGRPDSVPEPVIHPGRVVHQASRAASKVERKLVINTPSTWSKITLSEMLFFKTNDVKNGNFPLSCCLFRQILILQEFCCKRNMWCVVDEAAEFYQFEQSGAKKLDMGGGGIMPNKLCWWCRWRWW